MGADETSLGQGGEPSPQPSQPSSAIEVPPVPTIEVPPPPGVGAPPPAPPSPPQRRFPTRLIVIAAAIVAIGVVIGVAIGLAGGGGTKGSSAKASPSRVVLAPTDLSGTVDLITVTLTWKPAAGGLPVAGYNLYRDGELLASVSASTTSYSDTPQTGKEHTYQVSATGSGLTSSLVAFQVYLPAPSLALSRLEGDFNVRAKLQHQSGFRSYPSPFTIGWHFIPKCADGACDVAWSDLSTKSFRAALKRHGFSYGGSDTGDFRSVCGHTHVQSKLDISFRVVKAQVRDGVWRATRLIGTIVQTDAPQLGCVGASATLSITATLLVP
jgi:hypothetical protein